MIDKNFLEQIAGNLVEVNRDTKENFLTGEKNLILSKLELKDKLLKFENGKSYLGVLKLEHELLEGQGAINEEFKDGKVIFTIPDWDSFISRVNAFHVACGPY